jgi:hypothetical protein
LKNAFLITNFHVTMQPFQDTPIFAVLSSNCGRISDVKTKSYQLVA